jgi:iron complex outermembrane receptor protein
MGFDVDVKAGFPLGEWGKITADLAGTYFQRFDLQNPDGTWTPEIGTADQTLSANGGVVPRWKHRLTVDWARGNWDVLVAQNYQASYEDTGDSGRVGSYETYDLHVNYQPDQNWIWAGGIKNIGNTPPPYTGLGGSLWFQTGYDPSYGDPRGRLYYFGATFRFK